MPSYSLHRTLTPAYPGKAGPVNTILFFDDGTRLATGGDDQVVRIWDVQSGDCQQELSDSQWGQITNLSGMVDGFGRKTQGLLIGTGRGLVSNYPWHDRTQQFNRQSATNTVVFFDVPVESQAFDSLRSMFGVASRLGNVHMYTIKDRKHLVLTWKLSIGSSIPRSLAFMGDGNATLEIHTLMTGDVTGQLVDEPHRLRGGVGFVTVSSNRRQKAVHNLNTDRYDLYDPIQSTSPFSVSPSGNSRKIKGASFAEGGQTLVCGGDRGSMYVYNIADRVIEQELDQQDFGTICALNTCSTKDYHLIASGAGESPALIYIWGKPTERKHAEDMDLELERQRSIAQSANDAAAMALTIKKAEALHAEAAAQDVILQNLSRDVNRTRTRKFLLRSFVFVITLVFVVDWLTPHLRARIFPYTIPLSPGNHLSTYMGPSRHGARKAPHRRVAKTCDNCRQRLETRAQAVAPLTLEIDQATITDLERRLSSAFQWDLDEDINIPICCPFPETDADSGCRACGPYLTHLKSGIAGFSTDEAYLTHRRQNIAVEKPQPPVILPLEDGDSPLNPPVRENPRSVSDPPGEEEIPNPDQIEHLDRVLLLQSIRGRLIMNKFLHSDRAAADRLQGVVSVLASTERLEKEKRDQLKARLTRLTAELEQVQVEEVEMRQALEAVDDEHRRPRKCPDSDPTLASPHPSSFDRDEPMADGARTVTLGLSPANPVAQVLALGNLSPSEVAELCKKLLNMKAPGYDKPPEFFARWIQVHGDTRIKGVPIGPDRVVDLRDVRGRNNIMSRVPGPPASRKDRLHHSMCLFAVLKVLAIPGAYHRILIQHDIRVASDTSLACMFSAEYLQPPSDEDVVRLLASQGLTVEAATDSWQFCVKFLQAHVQQKTTLFDAGALKALLERANDELERMGRPQEFLPNAQDLLLPFESLGLRK
ncbi:WD40-repeat-containing domain protein [Mycena galericulata]|nr:WD40-repeat-containing domain protein [Mycena galericulata]